MYLVVGFFILPAILKWQLRKQLPALTQRTVTVASVRMNPLALSLSIRGLALTEADGSTFASFSNFYANFEAPVSLFNWALTFKEVRLGSPFGYAAVLTNGQFNFANLLTNKTTNVAPKSPPRVLVKSLAITNGTFSVADFYRADPFHTTFAPIDVRLTNFTTRPRIDGPYAFTASTGEGEYFKWAGKIAAVPPASSGKFELGGIDLKKYGTYLREFTQLDLRDGKVAVAATYSFAIKTNGVQLAITNADVIASRLMVFAPGEPPASTNALAAIPRAAVLGASANLKQRTIKVRNVEVGGGSIVARRGRDGTLELLQLAMPPTNRAPSILNPPQTNTTPAVAAKAWDILIENLVVNDCALQVIDELPPTPAHLAVDQIAITLKGLSLASNASVSMEMSARVAEKGAVKLKADGSLLPLAMTADVNADTIDLRPFQPYVAQQGVKLAFASGNVSSHGKASVALRETNSLAAQFTGDAVLDDVAVVDQIAFQDFIRWKQVAVRGIAFTLSPMSVKVGELACDELITSVVVDTNKQLTALAVLLQQSTNAAWNAAAPIAEASGRTANALLPFPVQLDVLALTNASLRFADLSLEPDCRFTVQQFSGTVRGLSSQLNSVAEVDIRGRVNESAPFRISGKVNPLVRDLFVDLVISNRNTELTAFTPYMEKFGGYPLTKGKVTVGLKYVCVSKRLMRRTSFMSINSRWARRTTVLTRRSSR